MADDVTVTFAASIEKLLAGINGGTTAIKGFARQVEEVTGSVGKVAEALTAAFAVDKIVEFVSHMAELGEQVERTSAMLGVSTASAQQLSFAAQMTGGSAESLALSMERLQVNLQKAQTGAGPAALALQALGMSAKDLIGLPLEQQMNKIADAISKFADGGNKTAIMMELLGRGGAQMIPVFDQGSEGLQRMRQALIDAGAIMSGKTVGVLAQMEHNLVTMKGAVTGLSATLVSTFAPAINSVVHAITDWISGFNAIIQGSKLWDLAIEDIRFAVKGLFDQLLMTGAIAKDVFTLDWGAIATHWKNGNKLVEEDLQEHLRRVTEIMGAARAEMAKGEAAAGEGSGKPQAPATPFLNKGAGAGAMKDLEGDLKVMQQGLAQKKLIYDADAAQFKITQDQKFALLQTAVQQEAAEEEKLLRAELKNGELSVEQRKTVENKIKELKAKTNTELIKLDEQSIAAQQKMWLGYIDTVTGAFNSQLRGLLTGTVSWTQAMKSMLLDLTVHFIEMIEKMGAEWLAGQLGMTTATTTGAAARLAAEQAATTATLPVRAAKFISDITADAAVTFAGIFANLAPLLGPGAAGPAAAGQATVLAELGAVPKLDIGGFVLSSGLAMIHKGETVSPASVASPFRSGGGGDVHIHLNAIDTQSGYAFLMQNMSAFARELKQHMEMNPSVA